MRTENNGTDRQIKMSVYASSTLFIYWINNAHEKEFEPRNLRYLLPFVTIVIDGKRSEPHLYTTADCIYSSEARGKKLNRNTNAERSISHPQCLPTEAE